MATITQRYLELARAKLAFKYNEEISDYRLAKELDIPQPTLSRYFRADKPNEADDEAAYKIAQIVDVPFFQIMGDIKASKARSERVAEEWKKLSKGMIAGVGAVSIAGALMATPGEATASPILSNTQNSLYIMLNWIRQSARSFHHFYQSVRLSLSSSFSSSWSQNLVY